MFEVVGIFIIILGLLWLFSSAFLARFNENYPKHKKEAMKDICILIPARYESKVIEDLLISITKQTYKINMKNVYVIIESKEDPTNDIAKKYGASVFIRKRLDLKSKGYALNEAITYLCDKNIYYDAYFIIDADNVLDKNFIKEMNKSYMAGYDIATSYRNLKNGNDSLISACSGITFTFLNSNGNETKSKQSRNVTLSGTGLFITGDLLKKWKSFPFHSLTEDYELTLYSILNNLTSTYNKNAIFYDEQPVKYKNTINQRVRWIKGYFSVRKEYITKFRKVLCNNPNFGSLISEITGMKPYILMIIGAIFYIIQQVINIIFHKWILWSFIKILLIFVLAYFLFSMMTFFILYKDTKINLNKTRKVQTVLFSPLFFVTYVPCALKALFKKNVKWEKVEHSKRWRNNS
jgi:cellulose synthase/poly-beta-1,6-N-acetylglucosamine synthase-like glycosyltransferase